MEPEFNHLKKMVHEQMALLFEQGGTSPLVGRIFSLLLFSSEPVSLQKMAEQLQVTKAAVSVQARVLEAHGLCYKLARGSDRKDYYQIKDNFGLMVTQENTRQISVFFSFLNEILHKLPTEQKISSDELETYQVAKRRLREMKALYELIMERLAGFEEEWEIRRKRILTEQE